MIINKTDYTDDKIVVDLTGPQGNAFYLIGLAGKLGRKILDTETTEKTVKEMMSGDYNHLIEIFDNTFGDFVILLR